MFAAASFTITKNWETPRYPSTWEWIGKLVQRNAHSRRVYEGMQLRDKRNRLLTHATTWMNFKCTLLSESQALEAAYDILEKSKLQGQKTGQCQPGQWSGDIRGNFR